MVDLSDNSFTGVIPESLGNLEYLEVLNLELNNFISDSSLRFLTSLTDCRKLRALRFNENALDGALSASVGNFSNLLQNFQGNGCKLKGVIPREIGNLTGVIYMSLYKNELTGHIPNTIQDMFNLQEFYLQSNEIEGAIPNVLCSLKDLGALDLSGNHISGLVPSCLGNVTSLRKLNLAYNMLNSRLPANLGNLQDLIEFNVSSNSLSGHIPLELGNLKTVTLFDLSKNYFPGKIPSTLGGLAELADLSLAHNRLDGAIPDSFGKMLSLEYLDLSYNNLSGEIPKSLEALVYLKYMNFSFNKLSGEAKRKKSAYRFIYIVRDWITPCQGSKGILKDGTLLAVKVFNVQLEGAFKSFAMECGILRNLRHRNLTKVITSCSNLDFKALVLEYMPNGTLDKWLYSHNLFLNLLQRLDIMIDVASAMDYLHNGYSTPIVHCDLKPSNALLDQEMVGHGSDFGIAKLLDAGEAFVQTRTIATIGYIAPEYGQDGIVSTSCDVYSFGILMMETFTRRRPSDEIFPGDEQIDAKMQCLLSITELALSCTLVTPNARTSMKDALSTLQKIRLQLVSSQH
ncbi:receptor kinase-like protein Xa21 [Solanum verrucosum]|uniref:receptor kinase-like protein Xa21 n=1 Tax=Solanum verrucosum TaxID=315347 RepID=UPI0020CFF3D2|nr:receptor kinase-like protein Xa21 [Solanum verrucosum]